MALLSDRLIYFRLALSGLVQSTRNVLGNIGHLDQVLERNHHKVACTLGLHKRFHSACNSNARTYSWTEPSLHRQNSL